jgi:hypothetical protein
VILDFDCNLVWGVLFDTDFGVVDEDCVVVIDLERLRGGTTGEYTPGEVIKTVELFFEEEEE